MILEDFVMLGKTAPEMDRQGRVTVCSAGWSPELRQLIRIYPLAAKNAPPDFSKSRIRVVRNHKDGRHESWKIAGDRGVDVHADINTRFDVETIINDRQSVVDQIPITDSITTANERRMSLAVIQPDIPPRFTFETNKRMSRKDFGTATMKYTPRLRLHVGGRIHNLKYLNQEAYEYEQETPSWMSRLSELKHRFNKNPKLLIGNMFAFRNNWLVISTLEA